MLVPIGIYSSAPGMGKTTVAKWLGHNHGYEIVSFAKPIKDMAFILLKSSGLDDHLIDRYLYDPEWKNTVEIPGIGVTMRHILQTLGTDWGRDQIHRDLWVNIALSRGRNRKFGGIVVDDMRFPNEFERMVEEGIVIRVVREVEDHTNNHASEGRLDDYEFNEVIYNNGTLYDLSSQLNRLFPPESLILPG